MILELNCFGCKSKYSVDVKPEHVRVTPNVRHVASVNCEKCNRKMTSLISKSNYENILNSVQTEKTDGGSEKSNLPS